MKIDRRNPIHWICLVVFQVNVLIALALRPHMSRHSSKRVLLYGHKLTGNIGSILKAARISDPEIEFAFLTMDVDYHRMLLAQGQPSVLATSLSSIPWMATADAVISDHGIHCLYPLLRWSTIKFFDVWHGIPFKGFDADDFRTHHHFDELWVASPKLAGLYENRFGFRAKQICCTGYARTDQLIDQRHSKVELRQRLRLPEDGPIVLYAPTWKQDSDGRSVFPFGEVASDFLYRLSQIISRHQGALVFRTHLNTNISELDHLPGVFALSSRVEPDTEAILVASDVLICDWSSIAFDFLLLERPTLFVDVPVPFRKGLTLGREYRFGEVVDGLESLSRALNDALDDPDEWLKRHGVTMRRVREDIYGSYADGRATSRCLARLRHHLNPDQ